MFRSEPDDQLSIDWLDETHVGHGGVEFVARVLEEIDSPARLVRLGIPDRFIDHGDQARLLAEIGLDREGIIRATREHAAFAPDECVAANQ